MQQCTQPTSTNLPIGLAVVFSAHWKRAARDEDRAFADVARRVSDATGEIHRFNDSTYSETCGCLQ